MIKHVLKPIVVCDFCEERETDYKCHVCNKSLCNECSTTIHPRINENHIGSVFSVCPTCREKFDSYLQVENGIKDTELILKSKKLESMKLFYEIGVFRWSDDMVRIRKAILELEGA